MVTWDKIKYLLKQSIILPLIVVPIGWIYVKLKYPFVSERIYVVIYQGIGDIIVSMGYLEAYLEKHNGKFREIFLIQIDRNTEIYNMYHPENKGYVYKNFVISKREYQFFCLYHETSFGFKSINGREDFIFVHTYNFIKDNWNYFYRMPGITFMSFIKTGILALDREAKFIKPQPAVLATEKRENLLKRYELKAEKVIVLNPYANTIMDKVQDCFWISLAKELIRNGYKVYTDCGKDNKAVIEGTGVMHTSLAELAVIAQHITAYIGLRSGLLDYVLFSGCKVFALYPMEKGADGNDVLQAFDINGINQLLMTPVNSKCWQYELSNERNVIDSILERLRVVY